MNLNKKKIMENANDFIEDLKKADLEILTKYNEEFCLKIKNYIFEDKNPIIIACIYDSFKVFKWFCEMFQITREEILESKVLFTICEKNMIDWLKWIVRKYNLQRIHFLRETQYFMENEIIKSSNLLLKIIIRKKHLIILNFLLHEKIFTKFDLDEEANCMNKIRNSKKIQKFCPY
jgi:hypothetical protein